MGYLERKTTLGTRAESDFAFLFPEPIGTYWSVAKDAQDKTAGGNCLGLAELALHFY